MWRPLLVLGLVASACGSVTESDPAPTSTQPVVTVAGPVTTVESASGVLSRQVSAWTSLGIADYDLEYVLETDDGSGSGTYRAEVRDGEAVNCYVDDALSMRIECDPQHYTVGALFDRLVFGDVRNAEVEYDDDWHFPSVVRHELRPEQGSPYSLQVTSFIPRDPVDWVAFVADAIDWLEENYAGNVDVDWEELRADSLALVTANPRLTNAYLGLERATTTARGALFLTPREVALGEVQSHEVEVPVGPEPAGERIGDLGYLNTAGAYPDQAGTYAEAVRDIVAGLDAAPVCGWVVDLRESRFTDIARDLLAFGELLGPSASLTVTVGGERRSFAYGGGEVTLNGERVADAYAAQGRSVEGLDLAGGPYFPSNPDAPIAVLTSIQSLDFPLVAFTKRPETRTFGEPAQGFLNVIEEGQVATLDLPLGGKLQAFFVAPSIAEVEDGYDPRPDELVLPRPDSAADEVLDAALAWLNAHPACA